MSKSNGVSKVKMREPRIGDVIEVSAPPGSDATGVVAGKVVAIWPQSNGVWCDLKRKGDDKLFYFPWEEGRIRIIESEPD